MGDFSTTNNPNGDWSYGRKWSAATDNFDIFTVPSWWFGNTGHGAPNVQPNSMWAKDNSNGLPCVRWTCPEAGNFSLTTTFTGGDSRGVDVIVYVTKNSIILFTDIIQANNAKVSYYFNDLSFAKSDHLDFLIKWNGGVDSEYSWTNVKAVITTTPQVTIPTLTTTSASSITTTTTSGGGNVTSDGGATITVRGVCWSTSSSPTTANNKTSNGTGTGAFSSSLTGLNPSTTYYIRAYATNSVGTSYGNEVSFTTAAPATLPVLTTTSASTITSTTASSGGNVSSDGGATITARGVCWSTNASANPTISDNKTTDGTGTGIFTSSLTGLNPSTTYYVRAYATNSVGTSYGNEISFTTTSPATVPVLTTTSVASITSTTAGSGGNITSDGGATVTVRGVCWSTTANPTTANNTTSDGSGTGTFTSSITGLAEGTTYYVRAYATNSAGTGYGTEVSFKTTSPTVADIDGNVYHTVTIGTQTWMVENLKTTSYRDGTPIPCITDGSNWSAGTAWSTLTTGAYCDYNNTPSNSSTYGKLYNWYAATDVRNIAPTGWHVPTDAEWTTLTDYLGGLDVAGGKLKETGTLHWSDPNTGATNETGFTALPGGNCLSNGVFSSVGNSGNWWSTIENGASNAWFRFQSNIHSNIVRLNYAKTYGFSVRCIKDN